MTGHENLIPMNKRSKEEVRQLASRGGKKSGKVRKAKKTMKEYAELLMGLDVTDSRKLNSMAKAGIPAEACDNKMLLVFALLKTAQSGDVQAAKEIRSILGEDKTQDMTAMEKLDEVLKQLNKGMKND